MLSKSQLFGQLVLSRMALEEVQRNLDLHFKHRPSITFRHGVSRSQAREYREHIRSQLWQTALIQLIKATETADHDSRPDNQWDKMWWNSLDEEEKDAFGKLKAARNSAAHRLGLLQEERDAFNEEPTPSGDEPEASGEELSGFLHEPPDMAQWNREMTQLISDRKREEIKPNWRKLRDFVDSLTEAAEIGRVKAAPSSENSQVAGQSDSHVPRFWDRPVPDPKIGKYKLKRPFTNRNLEELRKALGNNSSNEASGYKDRYKG